MSDNFQQTVDLRQRLEKRSGRDAPRRVSTAPLEKIYQPRASGASEEDFKKISRPEIKEASSGLIKLIVFVLAILAVGATVYFLFFRSNGASDIAKSQGWYAIKLVDGEIFYGQVADTKLDPIVINNVYYNYDQAKETGTAKEQTKTIEETGNIRLVKRGKETHGPDGSLNVVRSQVLYLEPMKSDSKVLKAILEYEK